MKKIRYILGFILGIGLFFIANIVYAESSIRLNIDKAELDIQDIVELRVDISLEDISNSIQIEIPGIDDFIVLGESQNQSTSNINGVISQNFVLILTLKGRESGNYDIGPITINDIVSNAVELEITGEQVFIGGQLDTNVPLTREEVEKQAEQVGKQIAEEYKQNLEDQKNKQIIEENATKTVPEEFRDIKDNSHISPLNWKNSLFLVLIFGLLFTAYKLYFLYMRSLQEKQLEEELVLIDKQDMITKHTNFQSALQDIETDYIDRNKEVFYGKLGSLMREYFDEKIESGLSSKTFGELQEKIKKYPTLARSYEKIYFPEYNLEQDTKEQRIEIINTLKDELI